MHVVFLAKGLWINSRLTGIEIMSKITSLVCPPADGKNSTLKKVNMECYIMGIAHRKENTKRIK